MSETVTTILLVVSFQLGINITTAWWIVRILSAVRKTHD